MNHNENKNNKKKKFKDLVFWSLLIHLIILILFLIFAFRKKMFSKKDLIFPKAKTAQDLILLKAKIAQEKKDTLASLKPRKSTFGTTVLFDDTPQFTPAKSKLMAEHDLPEIKAKEEQIQPIQKEEPKKESIKKEETKKIVEQKPKEIKEAEKPKTQVVKAAKIPELKEKRIVAKKEEKIKALETKKEEVVAKQEEQTKQEDIQKRIEEIGKMQQMLAQQPQAQKFKTLGKAQEDKSPITKSRKSIVALTKGFIENLKDEGDDWLERKGDDSKRPSLEELKYLSYEHEIQWQLQSSWKLNFEKCAPSQQILRGKLTVSFKINEDGSLLETRILQPSGIDKLDKIVIKSIEFASPFPPLPKHFETKVYETGRIFYVNMHNLNF